MHTARSAKRWGGTSWWTAKALAGAVEPGGKSMARSTILRSFAACVVATLVAATAQLVAPAAASAATTYVVNSTADPGNGTCDSNECTLREAISAADSNPGADVIDFSIGSGVQTISPTSALPQVTGPVTIDGTTQPGFSGAPLIEVSGANCSPCGLGYGLVVTAGSSTIQGLVLNRWPAYGIDLKTNGGDSAQGNYIGIDPSGTIKRANGSGGILIESGNGDTIGGTTNAARNVISGNSSDGIAILGGTGTAITGNYIGPDAAGTGTPTGGSNNVGVDIIAASVTVGGTAAGAGNVISGNTSSGIVTESGGNGAVVQANLIGTNAAGTSALANGSGIQIAANNGLFGGTVAGSANTIEFNSGYGVGQLSGTGNAYLGNAINSNGVLGIDLGEDGVTANDAGDGDSGPNNKQNYPVLSSADSSADATTVGGTLNSAANTTFRLEFFASPACDPLGFGEGASYLGTTSVATDGSGNASFSAGSLAGSSNGSAITSTATDPLNNTSEFSHCVTSGGASADLSISQSDSPDPVTTGQNVTYHVVVHNGGPDTAGAVSLSDALPSPSAYVSAMPSQGSCTHTSTTVTCSLGSIVSSADASVDVVVATQGSVAQSPADQTITNTASATSSTTDPNASNNTGITENTTVVDTADLQVTQSDNPDPVAAGADVTYTVTVTNNGPSTATQVSLAETSPPGASFVSATPSHGVCIGESCALGTISSGSHATVTVVVQAPDSAGTITNTASATASQSDPNPANNTAITEDTTVIGASADLGVTQSDNPDPVTAGSDVTYHVVVANGGPDDALEASLSDTLPSGSTYVSATPSQGSCSNTPGTVTCDLGTIPIGGGATVDVVVAAPSAPGTITNTAAISAASGDPNGANDSASENTQVVAGAVCTDSWTDASGGSWSDGSNWSRGVPPTALDHACIKTNGTYTVTLTGSASVHQLTIGGSSGTQTLAIQGDGCGSGAASLTSALVVTIGSNGAVVLTGTCGAGADATLTASSGGVQNTGTIDAQPGDGGSRTVSGDVTNVGAVGAEAGVTLNLAGDLDQFGSGTVEVGINGNAAAGPHAPSSTYGIVAVSGSASLDGTLQIDTASAPDIGQTFQAVTFGSSTGTFASIAGDAVGATEVYHVTYDATDLTLTAAQAEADLDMIQHIDLPDPVTVKKNVAYKIKVRNDGPDTAFGVSLTDTLPASTTYVLATPSAGSCSQLAGIVTCNLASLADGATWSITVIAKTPATPGSLLNAASASATTDDPNSGNNGSNQTTTSVPDSPLFAAGYIPPSGGSVATNAGKPPTPDEPETTNVTSPNEGGVGIAQGPFSDPPPAGQQWIGQQVNISAPDATPNSPMTIVFTIDGTQVPSGVDQTNIKLARDEGGGPVDVPDCTGDPGTADPDPCISARAVVGGDIQLTVLTSQASKWGPHGDGNDTEADVTLEGNGTGSVTSADGFIDCPDSCVGNYNFDEVTTLTATPDPGSIFAGWDGPCSGLGDCVLTMDASKTAIATFIGQVDIPVGDGSKAQNASLPLGGTVIWHVNATTPQRIFDPSHLGPDGTPLFDSGPITHGTFSYVFTQGGKFKYQISGGSNRKGSISLQVNPSPKRAPSGRSFQVQWATQMLPGEVADVQVRFKPTGSTTWSAWQNWMAGATDSDASYQPDRGTGQYGFRVRLRNPATKKSTGWAGGAGITVF
jgi:uncharacterized repeat protein (TIGR01451 family)/CSLREA domain-containing protein